MAFSPQKGDAAVSLSVFGGLVTEQPAASLPEGVSPDNQDVVYTPGGMSSRPALQRALAGIPAAPGHFVPTLTYGKTFITPTNEIENLYLDSNGVLYWENVAAAPGALIQIGAFPAGSWAKSITAFGREYIAVSDGLHGTDVAVQWDGTNLDRVTQDGPGAPPAVSSFAYPPVAMQASGAVTPAVTEADPASPNPDGSFSNINLFVVGPATGVTVGAACTLAGFAAAFNGNWTVLRVYSEPTASLIVLAAYLPPGTGFSIGGTATIPTGTMARQGNTVTVTCAAPHQLLLGYQALIQGVQPAAIGGSVISFTDPDAPGLPVITTDGITSLVISSSTAPGTALVTMAAPHGLLPNCNVNIIGVQPSAVGNGIHKISCVGGVVTVVTNAAHGLAPGSVVQIAATTNYNGTFTVLSVSAVAGSLVQWQFTFLWTLTAAPASEATGTVSLTWPIPDQPDPTYFQVLSCPSPTTFTVAVNYSDGTWITGAVLFAWQGTFFVTSVIGPSVFQFQQYGPDANTGQVGSVTPWGQAAPGTHQCRVSFLTRNGAITRPSPPVQFVASGGQYLSVSNIAVGPPNVVGRILQFTGAEGSFFYYIPAPAQVNGQQVATATQINDNTTTSALIDFSDPTLFAASATSVPGNDLAAQILLDGALGFGFYASRIVTWGQRNRIQNLLNMGFDGGQIPSAPLLGLPLGWSSTGTGGQLSNAHFGQVWAISGGGTGTLSQAMYEDAYGAPIAQPNTQYRLRVWLQAIGSGPAASFNARISSASTGFVSTASILSVQVSAAGGFVEAAFSSATPASIPADLTLTVFTSGLGVLEVFLVDDISILYADNPYTDELMFMSYAENPEGFDGLTGAIGSTDDGHKIMDLSDIRGSGYFLTQDPGGRLHEFSDNGVTEPAGWTVRQVGANCGVVSAFGLTKSQADDSSASGGEEWFAWASSIGARIFGGDQPYEISREIRPDWAGVNKAALPFVWALNDPISRTMYFGLPLGTAQTASRVYVLNYVGLDSAFAIATTGPVRISYSGKRVATDHSRKWTRWSLSLNGGVLMSRGIGDLQPAFLCGTGRAPSAAAGFGNCYTLDPARFTDDDYGQINPYWTTFFFPGEEMEQVFQLAGFRKLLVYVMAYASAPVACSFTVQPYVGTLANAWPFAATRQLTAAPAYDMEFAGGNAQGNRIALKFYSSPLPTKTDNGFSLQTLTALLRKITHLPVRGAA